MWFSLVLDPHLSESDNLKPLFQHCHLGFQACLSLPPSTSIPETPRWRLAGVGSRGRKKAPPPKKA